MWEAQCRRAIWQEFVDGFAPVTKQLVRERDIDARRQRAVLALNKALVANEEVSLREQIYEAATAAMECVWDSMRQLKRKEEQALQRRQRYMLRFRQQQLAQEQEQRRRIEADALEGLEVLRTALVGSGKSA